MDFDILCGDSAEVLKQFDDNTFDSVITDPPYGISFLNKDWDRHTGTVELWEEVYRVMKPGAHLLAFSAPRTCHRLATNLEEVGFEIRDQIVWLYSSGFPKGQDVGKGVQKVLGVKEWGSDVSLPDINGSNLAKSHEGDPYGTVKKREVIITDDKALKWKGWNTGLKPAHEPIVMAIKPMKGSVPKNILEHGVGALNIDACRVHYTDKKPQAGNRTSSFHNASGGGITHSGGDGSGGWAANDNGRFPSNVVGEVKGYQKYFYCPKPNKHEKHLGLSMPPNAPKRSHKGAIFANDNASPFKARDNQFGRLDNLAGSRSSKSNSHPTVKPMNLMAYLVRLVTPKGGKILDPFSGSGSTGLGCILEGMDFTGIELDPTYVEISEKRLNELKNTKGQ